MSGSDPARDTSSQTTPKGDEGPAAHAATPEVLPAPVGAHTTVSCRSASSRSWFSRDRGSTQAGTSGTPTRARDLSARSATATDRLIAHLRD